MKGPVPRTSVTWFEAACFREPELALSFPGSLPASFLPATSQGPLYRLAPQSMLTTSRLQWLAAPVQTSGAAGDQGFTS